MYIKTKAIVLNCLKFKDADLIVKCYSEQKGSISFIVKGVLKSKKGKLRPAMFQMFNILNIEFFNRDKGQLEYFKDVRVEKHLNSINTDVYKSTMVMFLSEVLKSVIFEEEQNEGLYNFLENSIIHLENTPDYANYHISFLIHLSSYLGFTPHLPTHPNEKYFNLYEGYFEDTETKYSLSLEKSELLQKFLNLSLEQSHTIKLKKEVRHQFLKLILVYYELHIETFKKPKSLEVIESIFN
jgi:DNA repair protein RecO (recombination protein O)